MLLWEGILEGNDRVGAGREPWVQKNHPKTQGLGCGIGVQGRTLSPKCHPQLSCLFPSSPRNQEAGKPVREGETRRKGTFGVGSSTLVSPMGCQKHLYRKSPIHNPLSHPAMNIPVVPRSLCQLHQGQPQQNEIKSREESGACEYPPSLLPPKNAGTGSQ